VNAISERLNQSVHIEDYTLLIVDDNPANIGVLSDYLEEYGFTILIATKGEIALQRAQYVKPDLILLDVMMPGIDGFETCARLKTDDRTKNIPVIFMTALTNTEDKVKGFEVGGVDYITKPIQHEEVLARITTHLHIRDLTKELQQKNQIVTELNNQLKSENVRMKAELEVAHRLQQMALPIASELEQIEDLDIVGFMEPAEDVGGDYYDVLLYEGRIKIGIGDVTGHGLESGVLMLVVQTAVQSLLESGISDPEQFLNILNRIIYHSVKRMKTDKNLTLSLLDYKDGILRITGQHEDILLVRKGGKIEIVDTFNLGFMIGIMDDITKYISHQEIKLQPGDGIVLHTDGITEAHNIDMQQYGLKRLCEVISISWHQTAKEIQQAVIADVKQYIGEQKVFDDITLLVLKQK